MTEQERTERRFERLTRWAMAHSERAVTNPSPELVYLAVCASGVQQRLCWHNEEVNPAMNWMESIRHWVRYCGNPWRAK